MKVWVRWAGVVVATIGSIVFVGYVVSTLDLQTLRAHATGRGLAALLAATLLYTLLIPINAVAWQRLLAALGHGEKLFPLLAITASTQAGKYLPGNVAHHIGRFGLSLALRMPAPTLVASMAYETCLLLLATLVTTIGAGMLSGPGLQVLLSGNSGNAAWLAVALAIAGIATVPLLSRALPLLTRTIASWQGRSEVNTSRLSPLGPRTMVEVIALYIVAMLLVGVGLAVLSIGLVPGKPVDYAWLIAAFTIAWVVGFVTPGAPAGLGVREALLLLMLSPAYGGTDASLLVLALRIATTLGDMLGFALGLAMLARIPGMTMSPMRGSRQTHIHNHQDRSP